MLAQLKRNIINIPGWSTNQKIIVFESDDWGMIRTASQNAFNRLLRKGYPVDKCIYNRNDALETNDDVLGLMEVLNSVKDSMGNPAKFTINNIVANPDFIKIRESGFEKYYYEPFYDSLNRYTNTNQVMSLYAEAKDKALFQLQFHGREHVNVNRWLEGLQNKSKVLLDAFDEEMFTVASGNNTSGRRDYLDAFGEAYNLEIESMQSIIESGTALFEEIWGYRSITFIAPCYNWPKSIEPILSRCGIKYIQGIHFQSEPKKGLKLESKKIFHYQGQKGANKLRYLVRNAHFEPVEKQNEQEVVLSTMKQIENAFLWHKPAVIGSHRVNYIGSINAENRNRNLKALKQLLQKITSKYPDVVFMSSDQLGQLIENSLCAE
jgi:hypothetical protein